MSCCAVFGPVALSSTARCCRSSCFFVGFLFSMSAGCLGVAFSRRSCPQHVVQHSFAVLPRQQRLSSAAPPPDFPVLAGFSVFVVWGLLGCRCFSSAVPLPVVRRGCAVSRLRLFASVLLASLFIFFFFGFFVFGCPEGRRRETASSCSHDMILERHCRCPLLCWHNPQARHESKHKGIC